VDGQGDAVCPSIHYQPREVMTRRHADIIKKMKAGARLWRYSAQNTGYLIVGNSCEDIRKSTINKMMDAGLIEVDQKESYYRESSGSDEIYKVVEKHEQA
jgi:hypothetical protein